MFVMLFGIWLLFSFLNQIFPCSFSLWTISSSSFSNSFDVEFFGDFSNDDYNALVDNFGDFNLKYVTIDNDLRRCGSKICVGFDRPYIFK